MQPPTPLLRSHRAIITGGSRGIGLAIARLFAQEGASCLLVARSEGALKQAVGELEGLRKRGKGKGMGKGNGDAGGDEAGAGALAGAGEEQRFGYVVGGVAEEGTWRVVGERETSPTILVNAAGITHRTLLLSTPTPVTQEILNTNLLGTILGCKAVAKSMVRARNGGCIINLSSVYGLKGGKGSAVYAASKAGVIGLSRALAGELAGARIRVNSLSPGFVDTEMLASSSPEERKAMGVMAPAGRLGLAEEVARAALFIATNGFVNGGNLVVDGGLCAT